MSHATSAAYKCSMPTRGFAFDKQRMPVFSRSEIVFPPLPNYLCSEASQRRCWAALRAEWCDAKNANHAHKNAVHTCSRVAQGVPHFDASCQHLEQPDRATERRVEGVPTLTRPSTPHAPMSMRGYLCLGPFADTW